MKSRIIIFNVLLKIEKCKGVNSKDAVKKILCDFFINVIENNPKDFTKIYYLSYNFILSRSSLPSPHGKGNKKVGHVTCYLCYLLPPYVFS